MAENIKLFVVDTSPLITLAAANSLDYLLFAQAQIIIPDAVFFEATDDVARLGAPEIINWTAEHADKIHLVPTNAYDIFRAAKTVRPDIKQPGLGEASAVEIINRPRLLADDERAILLCEENSILNSVSIPEHKKKILVVSTMDFLKMLERHQLIQSFDAVLENARVAGRSASTREHINKYDESTQKLISDVFKPLRGEDADRPSNPKNDPNAG